MKIFKNILFLAFMLFVVVTFSQCAGTKTLEEKTPLTFGDVYYQQWVSGVQSDGSGINIFIPIRSNPNSIILDSVYFQGRQAKLEYSTDNLFIGRFESEINKEKDIIMSSEPYAEYGNQIPNLPKKILFQLKEDECLISYKIADKVHYFKIEKVNKKTI